MSINTFMDNEGKRRVHDKDYGGYFYIFKNDKFIKRCKNQGLAIHALIGAALSNTTQSFSLSPYSSSSFVPQNYNSTSSFYDVQLQTQGTGFDLIIVPSITLNTGSTHAASNPPTVVVASDYSYLNVIMDFGVIGSGASITQISLNLGLSDASGYSPLFLSNVNIPFNSSAALTITWQLVL